MTSRRKALADLARAAPAGLISVKTAAEVLGTSPREAAVRLARFTRGGWLARARRGLYLILPLEAKPGTAPIAEDAWVLAARLFAPCYIGGWTAAEHWALTEQLFRSTFVVSSAPQRRQREERLSLEFHIVRVRSERLRGTSPVWRGRERVPVSSRERTIVDALVHPNWVGGMRHLAEIFTTYRESKEFDARKFLACAVEHGTGSAFKRLGYLAERLWPNETAIVALAKERRTTGVIRLDPAMKRRGKMNKRWGLWVNVAIEGVGSDS